jgi:Xaa-Pro dipeptidase
MQPSPGAFMSYSDSYSRYLHRQEKLYESLVVQGVEALALNAGPSLTYLTGLNFHLSERPVVAFFRPEFTPVIVLPELEAAKVVGLQYQLNAHTYGEDPSKWDTAFLEAVNSLKIHEDTIGIEPRRMRVLELRLLERAVPQARFTSAEDLLAGLRMYKDEVEIEAMRWAVEIAQDALEATLPMIRSGVTEKQVAAELTIQLLRNGSSTELPFSPIVASGPNSANPHATPTNRTLMTGDLLIIDWGASYEGYVSDLTRTFAVGSKPDSELLLIASIVEKANQAALEKASPGIPAGEVDRAARDLIEETSYGQYFIHRTGHGLGMEGHEEPYIHAANDLLLAAGMVFTIEPGIYLPGRGGVRIEDDVVITTSGAKSMSDLPRHLIVLD